MSALAIWSAALIACDDPLANSAIYENVVDTVTIYALSGTSVSLPSGFDVVNGTTARTDRTEFDFALDMDAAGGASIYTPRTLGLASPAGLLEATVPFDSVVTAADVVFDSLAVLPVTAGSVFMVRSRLTTCSSGIQTPIYGKFGVLSVDAAIRSMTLEALVNLNCGYRGLLPGDPVE